MSLQKAQSKWADLMAVFWVQQYFTLPVIFEHPGMGDEPSHRHQPALTELSGTDHAEIPTREDSPYLETQPAQQQTMEFDRLSTQSFGMGQMPGSSLLNMGGMASALPDYRSPAFGSQPFQQTFNMQGLSNAPNMYHYQQGPQFAGQTRSHYEPAFSQQYPSTFVKDQHARPPTQSYMALPGYHQNVGQVHEHYQPQPYYQQQQQHAQHVSNPYQQTGHSFANMQGTLNPYLQGYGARTTSGQAMSQMRPEGTYYYGPGLQTGSDQFSNPAMSSGVSYLQPSAQQNLSRQSSDSSIQASIPRGPPRKPKQSGHALWVGNLPPGTHVADLKDHFSRDATKDIESVFLISKSNCAFVNYRTESACAAAMTRFHDSRFQGVRLVCRLRRGSAPSPSTAPADPPSTAQTGGLADPQTASPKVSSQPKTAEEGTAETSTTEQSKDPVLKVKERFFIVKSLTVEDLDLSVRNSIWATQAHNESALNKAYESAESVYLIFSANKSGEYFGYARMTSSIDEEAASTMEVPAWTGPAVTGPADLPTTIPTQATENAPKGRIIDDSARGTIFWEADIDSDAEELRRDESHAERGVESDDPEGVSPATPQSFGKPFKIAWISTERLPFYRTRGLRNPWNANREVKIARDGTELEPSVGRRLVSMFHRPQMMSTSPMASRAQPLPGGGYGMPMGYGPQHPSGRPY